MSFRPGCPLQQTSRLPPDIENTYMAARPLWWAVMYGVICLRNVIARQVALLVVFRSSTIGIAVGAQPDARPSQSQIPRFPKILPIDAAADCLYPQP